MKLNTNTRVRWEIIRKLPVIKSLRGKKILDVGAGLGYFSVHFAELGAKVLAVDIDSKSLEYLKNQYNVKTFEMNLEKDDLPSGTYDLVFIGEILEHIDNPNSLLLKAREVLAPSGYILVTTPALEGPLINTKGKMLGHRDGSEKHYRNGFSFSEFKKIFLELGMEITFHTFSVFFFAELFMQLTKLMYFKKKITYASQSDVFDTVNSFKFKMLKIIYPALLIFFNVEQRLSRVFRLKGHCHIILARKKAS
ncbi:MAG: class I SAM-dependent methyltransferase [Candidatus Latescibacteria bacterium]|jgi:SAM-dependent methyltransferase|nr:class I SAM-dependent methyltransferase [Candidatus Latescibacterota bacterium]